MQQHETTTLLAMLQAMDRGETFTIGWRTCNLKKGTGGEYIKFDNCIKHNHQTRDQRKAERPAGEQQVVRRNPNHFKNSTRNIRRLDTGDIITVHIRLIRQFNGKTVM